VPADVLAALPLPELLSPWALGLLGLLIGSFLNVVIHRLPLMLERQWWADIGSQLADRDSFRRVFNAEAPAGVTQAGTALEKALSSLKALGIARPASHCPACGHKIRWFENIPVLSWLALRGRCSACGTGISVRYPFVELLTGGLFFVVALHFGPTSTTVVFCAAIALLVAATFIDFDTQLLPDALTFPLLTLGILAAWQGWSPVTLEAAALGALFGYGSLWLLTALYAAVRGVQGMAPGDFKLLAGLGALLGWQSLFAIVLLSSAVGAVVGIAMILARRHKRDVPMPFGPYLAGGGVAAMFFGHAMNSLILGN
jgi:leader peptidase (prepilin peptidase)/N-methyltransferase